MNYPKITTIQVFKAMGVHPTPNQSWSVGLRVAMMYIKEHGEQPPKENRPKTNGPGVHCFALYPHGWRPRIEQIIHDTIDFDRRQKDLFGDES
jgi:hypothetical protein